MSHSIMVQANAIACLGNVHAAKAAHMGGIARPAVAPLALSPSPKVAGAERRATACHVTAAQGVSSSQHAGASAAATLPAPRN